MQVAGLQEQSYLLPAGQQHGKQNYTNVQYGFLSAVASLIISIALSVNVTLHWSECATYLQVLAPPKKNTPSIRYKDKSVNI
jgi:hypothetical protein